MTTENTPEKTRQMSMTVLDDGVIRAEFGPGLDPLSIDPSKLPEDILPQAVAEGIRSFLRARGSKLSGDTRTPAALRAVVAEGIDDLLAGKWFTPRAASTSTADITADAEAAHVYRKTRFAETNPGEEYTGTLAADAAAYKALDEGKQKKLKAVPRFQVALATVKAARMAAKAAKLEKKVAATETEDSDF